MATRTTNYGLVKPALTDAPPDITVMNPNWDKIDDELTKAVKKAGDVMTGSLTVIDNFNVNKTFNDVEYKTYVRPINYSIGNNGDYSTGLIHYKDNANHAQLMFNKDGVMLRDNVNAKAYKLFGQHNVGDAPFLPLTGGTLSGNLYLYGGHGAVVNDGNGTHVFAYDSGKSEFANSRYLLIGDNIYQPDVKNALKLTSVKNGVITGDSLIYGSHNKPFGSYTGNGSSTERNINTGGIGNALLLQGNGYSFLVTSNGAFGVHYSDGTSKCLPSTNIRFNEGILTIGNANSAINANSTNYWYQVL